MTLRLNNDLIDDQLQLIIDAMDAGSGVALFHVYDGTQPAKGGTATTLLAEFEMKTPFATIVSHALDIDLPDDTVGVEDGVPTWGRFVDSDNNFVADVAIPADVAINVALISVDTVVRMLSASISSSN